MKRPLLLIGMMLALLFCSMPAAHADIKSDMDAKMPLMQVLANAVGESPSDGVVEAAVMAMVQQGANPGEVVKMALDAGYDPGAVITGAVRGGGDLVGIIRAAVASGKVDSAECARICRRAGADPDMIASAVAVVMGGGEAYGYHASGETGPSGTLGSIPAGGGGGGGANTSNNQ